MKKFVLFAAALSFAILGFGCSNKTNNKGGANTTSGNGTPEVSSPVEDVNYQNNNTKVTFVYGNNLQPDQVEQRPGSVSMVLKKVGETGLLDGIKFSSKTHDAWVAEMKMVSGTLKTTCDNEDQPGCEKWDQNFALYQKALTKNDFKGYYALGTNKKVIAGIPFVILVSYNLDNGQFKTTYIGYSNNTRITFVDPASGGLEYGEPFQMDAKNRELVEITASRLAKRQKIDDVKMRARADEFYQLVSTVKVSK